MISGINTELNYKNITVCDHPIAKNSLSVLRDKNTCSELFRNATKRLVQILFINATDNIPTEKRQIETPLIQTDVDFINSKAEIVLAPILRAGLVFSEVASELLPDARFHHIGLYRDETTLKPIAYYNNLPETFKSPQDTYVYLLDPMLATGGSAISAIKLFTDLNIPQENIRFICLISAPEGIKTLNSAYPDVKIITSCIDKCLNQNGYILPGLGDAGDRTFNTIY